MNERVHGASLVHDLANSEEVVAKGVSFGEVKQFAKTVLTLIQEGLRRDGLVRIHEFGTFRLKRSKERMGRNPQTGQQMLIHARARVLFTPAKALRDLIDPRHESPLHLPGQESAARDDQPAEAVTRHDAELYPLPLVPPVELVPEPESQSPQISDTVDNGKQNPARSWLVAAMVVLALLVGYVLSLPDPMTVAPVVARVEAPKAEERVARALVNEVKQPARSIPQAPEVQIAGRVESQPAVPTPTLVPAAEDNSNAGRADEVAEIRVQIQQVQAEIARVRNELSGEENKEAALAVTESAEDAEREDAIAAVTVDESKPSDMSAVVEPPSPTLFFAGLDYRLAKGDSLWRLSRKNYREPIIWPHIFNANKNTIRNPNMIRAGRMIRVPTLEGPPGNLSPIDRRSIAEGYYLMYRYLLSIDHHETPFALFAVAHFDGAVLEEHRDDIEREYPATLKITQLFPGRLKGLPTGATQTGIPTFD